MINCNLPFSNQENFKSLCNKVNSLPSYTEYRALLSQSGTSAPTGDVLVNTLTGSWSYISEGIYHFTSIGAFSNPIKVEVYIPGVTVLGFVMTNNVFYIKSASRLNNDTIEVRTGLVTNDVSGNLKVDLVGTSSTDILENNVLSYTPIKIRVWS